MLHLINWPMKKQKYQEIWRKIIVGIFKDNSARWFRCYDFGCWTKMWGSDAGSGACRYAFAEVPGGCSKGWTLELKEHVPYGNTSLISWSLHVEMGMLKLKQYKLGHKVVTETLEFPELPPGRHVFFGKVWSKFPWGMSGIFHDVSLEK